MFNKKTTSLFATLGIYLFLNTSAFAQTKKGVPENWQTKDPVEDKIMGTASDKALKTLSAAGKTSKTIIVGVIDSGVEVDHQDLKDVIWVNEDEIPNNGIDDDKNGYVDDVNGWSFLGGKNGDIEFEATELARLYQKGKKKYAKTDTLNLRGNDLKDFEDYKILRAKYKIEESKLDDQVRTIEMLSGFINRVKKQAPNGEFSKATVKSYQPSNPQDAQMKKRMGFILNLVSAKELDEQISSGAKSIINLAKFNKLNVDSIREAVVGDNPDDINNRFYGCNRVEGPDALHGTHVAGIIAAIRNNNIGINGEAPNVKIMAIRAVPSGDERDKDIANAIRYAVDNGATVINMSFGKYYFTNKPLVDEAIRYAQSKDVLLIHAAGNDSKNKDKEDSYPTRDLNDGTRAANWIEVGASAHKKGKKVIGTFSNYGKTKVDLFAPGVDIYSTVPDNKYLYESGTSMASPAVAGVAAIIRGYFPELNAAQVREVLMLTTVKYKKKVKLPGSKKQKTKLQELCISGGFVNTNNAVKYLLENKK